MLLIAISCSMANESKAERCCRIFTGWIPVLLVGALIAFSYYAYVIQLCLCKSSLIVDRQL